MVVSLVGNNSYALQVRLNELVDKFVLDHGELALERIDAEEKDLQYILEAVQGGGFLTTNKLIVIRGLSQNKVAAEQIEQILSSISTNNDLIIYEPVTDKRTVFYKYLKANTELEEHSDLDNLQLAGWLAEEAKKHEGTLSFADAKYLVDRLGTNQAMLASELEKLILYDKSVSRMTIDELVEPTPQSKIFELLDAVFAGNKKRALDLYADQRAQKVEPQAVLAMLAWQLQILALAKFAGNNSPNQIAKHAGMNPYPITKAMGLVSMMDSNKLKQMILDATEMDYKSKTSGLDLDEALKTYIVAI
jgi:DNA polymerase III subunit delta